MSRPDFSGPDTPAAPIHRLSNGRYEVAISAVGSGQSSCRGLALNRWRNDPVADNLGFFFYLRNLDSGRFWSVGHQPARRLSPSYRVVSSANRFTVSREDEGIEAGMQVSLATGTALEIRRLALHNASERPRRIELTSYLEVVLFPGAADAAHAAFAKLFLQTQLAPAHNALLARRRCAATTRPGPGWCMRWLAAVSLSGRPTGCVSSVVGAPRRSPLQCWASRRSPVRSVMCSTPCSACER